VLALRATLSNVVPILGGMIALGESLPSDPRLVTWRLLAFSLTLGGAAQLVRLTPSANFPPAGEGQGEGSSATNQPNQELRHLPLLW